MVKKNIIEKISVGKRIAEVVKLSGLSQVKLAEMVEADRSLVSRWVHDKATPGPKYRRAIANATGCNLEWLESGKLPIFSGWNESETDREVRGGAGETLSYFDKIVDRVAGERSGSTVAESRQGFAMLERIYGSGDQMMVQAINVSLSALNEALGYKELAKQVLETQRSIQEDMRRLRDDIDKLRAENELFRIQHDCKHKGVAGG